MTKWVVFMQNYEIRHFNKLFGDKLNPSFFTQNVNKVTALKSGAKQKKSCYIADFIEHFLLSSNYIEMEIRLKCL